MSTDHLVSRPTLMLTLYSSWTHDIHQTHTRPTRRSTDGRPCTRPCTNASDLHLPKHEPSSSGVWPSRFSPTTLLSTPTIDGSCEERLVKIRCFVPLLLLRRQTRTSSKVQIRSSSITIFTNSRFMVPTPVSIRLSSEPCLIINKPDLERWIWRLSTPQRRFHTLNTV